MGATLLGHGSPDVSDQSGDSTDGAGSLSSGRKLLMMHRPVSELHRSSSQAAACADLVWAIGAVRLLQAGHLLGPISISNRGATALALSSPAAAAVGVDGVPSRLTMTCVGQCSTLPPGGSVRFLIHGRQPAGGTAGTAAVQAGVRLLGSYSSEGTGCIAEGRQHRGRFLGDWSGSLVGASAVRQGPWAADIPFGRPNILEGTAFCRSPRGWTLLRCDAWRCA
jgi:hypothetical protein